MRETNRRHGNSHQIRELNADHCGKWQNILVSTNINNSRTLAPLAHHNHHPLKQIAQITEYKSYVPRLVVSFGFKLITGNSGCSGLTTTILSVLLRNYKAEMMKPLGTSSSSLNKICSKIQHYGSQFPEDTRIAENTHRMKQFSTAPLRKQQNFDILIQEIAREERWRKFIPRFI